MTTINHGITRPYGDIFLCSIHFYVVHICQYYINVIGEGGSKGILPGFSVINEKKKKKSKIYKKKKFEK